MHLNAFEVVTLCSSRRRYHRNIKYYKRSGVLSALYKSNFPCALYFDFKVYVQEASNPTRVRVFGPAVERPVQTFQPTYLVVDCSEAGPGTYTSSLSFSLSRGWKYFMLKRRSERLKYWSEIVVTNMNDLKKIFLSFSV